MKIKSTIIRVCLSILLGGGIILSSCESDRLGGNDDFTLLYPSVTNIAPGKNLDLNPSWSNGKPEDFQIDLVKCDGESVQTGCFIIDPETGVFKLRNTEGLPFGCYQISVTCLVGGRRCSFPDLISVRMMRPCPEEIVMEPSSLEVLLSEIVSSEGELPTSKVVTKGGSHVTVSGYSIANVYKDGQPANELSDWFGMSEEGVFSIVADNEDFEPGIYTFDIRLTTYFVDGNDEEGLFSEALTLKVTSPPYDLRYSPASKRVEEGMSDVSPQPQYKGSTDGLRFEIESVLSAGTTATDTGVTIDPQTGVLSLAPNSKAKAGDQILISVKARNNFGEKVFADAFTFEMVGYISPITEFSYADVPKRLAGSQMANAHEKMNGTEVTYSFVGLPEALEGLSLDENGTVVNPQGNEFPTGTYTVTVRAENVKGSMDASFRMEIVNFTGICWGNNMDLEPLSKYGSQFRIEAVKNNVLTIPLSEAEHDIPEGYQIEFRADRPSTATSGITISSDGTLTIKSNDTSTKLLYNTIVAKITDGQDSIVRRIPVFADKYNPNDAKVLYSPFAIRVNPKTGGVSQAVVTGADGRALSSDFYMDFYKETAWFNLNGPESHDYGGYYKNDGMSKSFLRHVWGWYYADLNKKLPTSMSNNPISYWKNASDQTLPIAAAYIDPTDGYQIKVNPERFKDDLGIYADGSMPLQVSFDEDDSAKAYRVFLWLDPGYDSADYEVE